MMAWRGGPVIKHLLKGMARDQRGLSLIEIVISTALLAILGVALLQGLSTMALGQGIHDERAGALVAGRAQLEAVKQATYDTSVTATPTPAYTSLLSQRTVGNVVFDLATTAQQIDTGTQLVVVVISNGGREVTRLQAYKVNR